MERCITKIILIEDGSVSETDIEKLEKIGFAVIIYRQGANMPEIRISDV